MGAKHDTKGEIPQPGGVAKSHQKSDSKVLIGIPAYNEEIGIGSIVLSASKVADEVVVVDDGSSDRTAEIASKAGATVIRHGFNRGKGSGIKTLFDYAKRENVDILVVMDGDGQHRTADIPKVVRPIEEDSADIVIGSRYIDNFDGGETPVYRRFGQEFLNTLVNFFSDTPLTDSQSGFRALSRSAVEMLDLETDSFCIESEMILKAIENDLEIEERPIEPRYEGTGSSTWNPIQHGLTICMYLLEEMRYRNGPGLREKMKLLVKTPFLISVVGKRYASKIADLFKF